MTVLLGFIFAAGAVAVVVAVYAWNDPGYAASDGPAEGWDLPGKVAGYQLGRWAEESRPHHHSEPTLDGVACLYCGSARHTTYLHASR